MLLELVMVAEPSGAMLIVFSEGSGLNDSVYGKCQAPIRMFLEQRGEQFEQQSVLKDLFLMGTSDNYGDMLTTMTAMSGFEPVGENGAYPADGMQEGYRKLLSMTPGRTPSPSPQR